MPRKDFMPDYEDNREDRYYPRHKDEYHKDECPEANPQDCCQIAIENKTQLVPPARRGTTCVEKKVFAEVEKVCPEKVVICGILKKKISYKTEDGCENTIFDEVPFQCFIDRDDANEGDKFEVVGKTILCTVFEREGNFGLDECGKPTLAFRLFEKDIVKVCIRKMKKRHDDRCDDMGD